MPFNEMLLAAFLVAVGLAGLAVPTYALLAYRATRGRSLNADAQSTTKVRVVSALLLLVGVLDLARRLV